MAPLPVIAGVARITLDWAGPSAPQPANVFHLVTSTSDEDQIGDAIETSLAAGGTDMFLTVQESYTLTGVDIILLDGTSATQHWTFGTGIEGQAGGNLIPQAAGVLSLHTDQRGPRGRGRMFLGPLGEADQDAGYIGISTPALVTDAWDDFNDALEASSIDARMVVASYVHAEYNPVRTFSMRRKTGTMRRRMKQLANG